jgi:hypothetical protein
MRDKCAYCDREPGLLVRLRDRLGHEIDRYYACGHVHAQFVWHGSAHSPEFERITA